jgi:hypothetical protein
MVRQLTLKQLAAVVWAFFGARINKFLIAKTKNKGHNR